MVRGLVILSILQGLRGLAEQHDPAHDVGVPLLPNVADPGGEGDGLKVSLHSDALLLSPGESFRMTAVVKSGLVKSLAHKGLWLGLQILRAQSTQEIGDSPSNHAVTWKQVEDSKATWAVTLEDEGAFTASLLARTPCDNVDEKAHEAVPCFLPLPLRQEGEVQLSVTNKSTRLVVSWDQTQTVEALSDLADASQGALKVSAVASDGVTLEQAFESPVQIVAVDDTADSYSSSENALGGTTTSRLKNGVAEFPDFRFLLPVVLFPPTAPMRVAVEVVTASGERDSSFDGEVELQLHAAGFHPEPLQQRHKVQCHHGLCLWNRLLLTVAAGQYRLKAAVVQETAESHSASKNARLLTPAFSAPIEFQKFEQETRDTKILALEPRADVQRGAKEFFRVGQPWDAEVAIGPAPLGLAEDILLKESLSLNRPLREYLPADSVKRRGAASLRREVNAFQRLRSRGRLLKRLKHKYVEHKIHLSVGDSSGDGSVALSGDVVGTTNEIGVAVIKGLSLWLKGDASSQPQNLWVKLRAVCVTCEVNENESPPAIESSKVYIDTSAAVGVYNDPTAALAAVSRWQHAKPFASNEGSLPVSLPGRPAQVCVQLLARPFADVLITAHPEEKLFRHGSASIRVTPYTWPQPACWQFEGISQHLLETPRGMYRKVTLQLRSADALYGNQKLLSWKGLAGPDGSVPIIVLPSPAIPRRSRLFHSLQRMPSRKLDHLRGQNADKTIWLDLQGGSFRGSARLLLLQSEAADEQSHDEHFVTAPQLQEANLFTALLWRNAAVMTELIAPQTHMMLEFMALGNVPAQVHFEGKCINKDAGGGIMSTIDQNIFSARQDLPPLHSSKEQAKNQNQAWQKLELTLNWKRLNPESAGILQHHIVCEFHVTAQESMQPLRLLPKSSVDIIATGFACQNDKKERCPQGTYSPLGSGRCLPCPEDAVCADPAEPPKPCSFGWQRRGEETECTPCGPGRTCKSLDGTITREMSEIVCPPGTYTKSEYPGVCIPCPPGFQCPNSADSPQPCPPGTSSLGGQQSCSAAPEGLIVVQGREHLPPRPCEDGLTPLEVDGIWFCGLDYSIFEQMREELPEHIRASIGDSPVFTASRAFPLGCDADYMNHTWCFSAYQPPSTWCPYFHRTRYTFHFKWASSVYVPNGGGYSQYFTTCGYHQRRRSFDQRDYCEDLLFGDALLGTTTETELLCPIGRYCGPDLWRDTNPGYFQVSWYGGVGGQYVTVLEDKTEFFRPLEYKCWRGYVCEGKHHFPWPCVPGTYANAEGTACIDCPAGWPCPMARTSHDQLVVPCWPGHYCPEGSASPTAMPCPAGTVNHSTAAQDDTACKTCPAGWICSERAFQAVGFEACPAGHYCGEGATQGTPCPPGTHAPFSGASSTMKSPEDCIACIAGYYCAEGSDLLQMLSSPCPAGRVCPPGTRDEDVPKCPPGFYSPVVGLTDAWECIPCPAGHYCDYGGDDSAPDRISGQCDAGTMSLNTGKFGDAHAIRPIQPEAGKAAQCVECEAGYKCIGGMRTPCGRGSFSENGTQCQKCEAGRYCPDEVTTREQMEQQKCPAGTYCEEGVDSIPWVASHPCPRGSYCPEGTRAPVECPAGKVNPNTGQADESSCTDVPAGYYVATPGHAEPEGLCAAGYYCPAGSTSDQMRPCPDGTYSYMCLGGAETATPTDGKTGDRCSPGGFCKQGATTKSYCERGKYNPNPGAASEDEQHVAEVGYYAPEGSSEQYPCEPGSFAPHEGLAACYLCPPGWITDREGQDECVPCRDGHYCPEEGSTDEIECPVGTYRSMGHAASPAGCYQCPPFKACTQVALDTQKFANCAPGYYCIYGSSSVRPDTVADDYDINKAGPCPTGFYCEGNTPPIPCPRGTLGLSEHQQYLNQCWECDAGTECVDLGGLDSATCPEGFFCEAGTVNARQTQNLCPEGQRCPAGSESGEDCPEGTFAPFKGMAECLKCPAGYLCESGSTAFEGQSCEAGYFCLEEGTYSSPGAKRSQECVECPQGFFCPQTTSIPIPCHAGKLCAEARLTEARGECPAGKFCKMGDNGVIQQRQCTAGAYCPAGSPGPLLCPIGKYLSTPGAQEEASCIDCPAGRYVSRRTQASTAVGNGHLVSFCKKRALLRRLCGVMTEFDFSYCGTPGLVRAEGMCAPGYFCPQGSFVSEPQNSICPKGSKCPGQSATFTECDAALNQYQPRRGQAVCENCPAGFICSTAGLQPCSAGKYCLPGVGEQPCREGTFNPLTGMQSASSCLPCPPGKACTQTGLSEADQKCAGGHYCTSGAPTTTPEEEWSQGGSTCTAGFVCPEGSISPMPCPSGSYCNEEKASSPKGQCSAGHYCAHHATEAKSTEQPFEDACPSDIKQGVCPPGAVCPEGSSFPFKCPAGLVFLVRVATFVTKNRRLPENVQKGATSHQSELRRVKNALRTKLPAHHGSSSRTPTAKSCAGDDDTACQPGAQCPVGYYCPAGSTTPISCPAGTTGTNEGSYEKSQCSNCPANMFCPPGGGQWPCHAGFVCTGGASVPRPMEDTGHMCPEGHECKAGQDKTPCKIGTYADVKRRLMLYDSKSIYCAPTSSAHDDCRLLQHVARWERSEKIGGESKCRTARSAQGANFAESWVLLPQRAIAKQARAAECLPCPKGYVCTQGTAEPSICPAGHYCEEGQEPKLCPHGTKSTFSGLSEAAQCIECGSGEACDGTQSVGSCKAGYLCLAGVGPSPEPPLWQNQYAAAAVQIGGPCPIGHFCPEGAKTPTACSRGSSTVGEGGVAAADCVICNAGWYCSLNSAGVLECPAGSYCPRGSIGPIECPAGTYNLSPMATEKDSCLECPAGYACMPGTVDYLQWPCPIGYYCPKGSGVAFPCEEGTYGSPPTPCPAGRLCSAESTKDVVCPAGSYCPGGTDVPLPCPQSYYCPEGSSSPGPCPDGSVCPTGVKTPILCPAGTYKGYFTDCVKNPSTDTCCQMCPPGTFAPVSGSSTCEPCPAGYLCYGGTATHSPQLPDVDNGEPCPVGHYCPPGSSSPEPCPAGTYNDKEAGGNLLEACRPCEPDTYSDSAGQSGCYACGPTSTAEAGATTCSCLGRHRWFQGIQGSCVCEGGYESYGLTGNSLSNVDSALDCQPIVRDNCSGSQLTQLVSSPNKLRDNEGYCLEPSTCEKNCINNKGGFVLLAGQCMCLPLRGADVVCDAECKYALYPTAKNNYVKDKLSRKCRTASSLQHAVLVFQFASRRTLVKAYYQNGALNFKKDNGSSVGKLQVADLSANGRALGSIQCQPNTLTDCAVHFYSTTQKGILGLFGTPESLQKEAKLRHDGSGAASSELTVSRRLATSEETPAVESPVQCLQLYDTVAWRLEEDTYPVFLKDSLLNSNIAIDLSAFAELETAFQSRRDEARGIKQTRTLEVYSPSNVEPDLTVVMLALGCVFFVLVALLVSISVARKLQYRNRQAVDQKGDAKRAAKVFGGRSAAIKAKRRLESLLADIIEQRLIKVNTEKVLALEPSQLEGMLSEIPMGAAQPQAFEMAFGALHQMSVRLNSFFSKGGSQYRRGTRDLATELSLMQKNSLKMLELIKGRLQVRIFPPSPH
ncbi:hypothetical protein Emed_003309 [Eimeria media]